MSSAQFFSYKNISGDFYRIKKYYLRITELATRFFFQKDSIKETRKHLQAETSKSIVVKAQHARNSASKILHVTWL